MLPILRSIVRKACIGQGRRCLSLRCSDLATIGRRSGRLGFFQTGGTLIPPRPFAYVPSLWFNPQISGTKIGESPASFNVNNGSEENKIQSEGITKSSKTIADSWVNFQRDLLFVIRLKLIIIISDDVVGSIMAFIYTISELLVNLVLFLMLLFATTLYGEVDIEETEDEGDQKILEDEEEGNQKIVEDEEEGEQKIVEDEEE